MLSLHCPTVAGCLVHIAHGRDPKAKANVSIPPTQSVPANDKFDDDGNEDLERILNNFGRIVMHLWMLDFE